MQITVTKEELQAIISSGIIKSIQINVEQPEEVQKDTELVAEANPWIDVPEDWDKPYCPDKEIRKENCLIEVEFRDGLVCTGRSCRWKVSWIQGRSDIIKYRKAI